MAGKRRNTRKKSYKKAQKKLPVLFLLGASAGAIDAITTGVNMKDKYNKLVKNYTGFNPATGTFSVGNLQKGLLPLGIGAAGSIGASKAGVNRRFPLPFIKA